VYVVCWVGTSLMFACMMCVMITPGSCCLHSGERACVHCMAQKPRVCVSSTYDFSNWITKSHNCSAAYYNDFYVNTSLPSYNYVEQWSVHGWLLMRSCTLVCLGLRGRIMVPLLLPSLVS
jgi:hypothetical protein